MEYAYYNTDKVIEYFSNKHPNISCQIHDYIQIDSYRLYIQLKNGDEYIYDVYFDSFKDITNKNSLTLDERKLRFSVILRKTMRDKNVFQEELAEQVNSYQSTISKYVRGELFPNDIMLNKIANVLGCSVDYLF